MYQHLLKEAYEWQNFAELNTSSNLSIAVPQSKIAYNMEHHAQYMIIYYIATWLPTGITRLSS